MLVLHERSGPRSVSDSWLNEFNGVAQSCFTLSCLAIFAGVSLTKREDSFNPLFKAILRSMAWVRTIHEYQRLSPFKTTKTKNDSSILK